MVFRPCGNDELAAVRFFENSRRANRRGKGTPEHPLSGLKHHWPQGMEEHVKLKEIHRNPVFWECKYSFFTHTHYMRRKKVSNFFQYRPLPYNFVKHCRTCRRNVQRTYLAFERQFGSLVAHFEQLFGYALFFITHNHCQRNRHIGRVNRVGRFFCSAYYFKPALLKVISGIGKVSRFAQRYTENSSRRGFYRIRTHRRRTFGRYYHGTNTGAFGRADYRPEIAHIGQVIEYQNQRIFST